MRKKCPYSELLWSAFVRMRKDTDQDNSEYGHFLDSVNYYIILKQNKTWSPLPPCVRTFDFVNPSSSQESSKLQKTFWTINCKVDKEINETELQV